MNGKQTAVKGVSPDKIQSRILAIRGVQVMLDRDLAELYGVPVERLNEQVSRNIERFPAGFMFKLSATEFADLKSQIATSNGRAAMTRDDYCGNLLWQSGLTLLAHGDRNKKRLEEEAKKFETLIRNRCHEK